MKEWNVEITENRRRKKTLDGKLKKTQIDGVQKEAEP